MAGTRAGKVLQMAELFYENLIKPDPDRIQKTGRMVPTSTLRHRATREAFAFVRVVGEGRVFTQALVRDALKVLTENAQKYCLHLPATPGFTVDSWIQDESLVLHKLLKRARKSTAYAMDTAETQMWDIEAYPDLDPNEDIWQISCICLFLLQDLMGLHKHVVGRIPRPR